MGWGHYFCFKNVNQANSNPVHESTTVPFLGLASISFPGPFPWLEGGVGKGPGNEVDEFEYCLFSNREGLGTSL